MADGKSSSDNAVGWFILSLVFLALILLFWFYYEFEIKNMVRWIRVGEMWLISWFIDEENYNAPWRNSVLNFSVWQEAIPKILAKDLDNDVMSQISTVAMYPIRYIFSLILIALGCWALFYGPRTHYRKKMGLDDLLKRQSLAFPYIAPFVNFNPANIPPRPPGAPVPVNLPAFAEALSPEEWLAYNEVTAEDGTIDNDTCYNALAKQLGPPWRGPMHLKPHRQVLLAAFCLKAARKRTESDTMLGELAKSWSHSGGLNLSRKLKSEARKVLRNRELCGKVLAKCNQHAYEATALIRALATAREEGGVLAPAQFVWLRAYDRTLWYPLNNLGRQSLHTEAFGAMAHYKAERMTQRPIPRPKMDTAVETLKEYMAGPKSRPIPSIDYGKSKKHTARNAKGNA